MNNDNLHNPVLLDSVLQYLNPKPRETYLDLTAGYGGHSKRVIDITGEHKNAVLVDRDQFSIDKLQPFMDRGTELVHQSFNDATSALVKQSRSFDMILLDLGVSSPQLDNAQRGFSFRKDAPLDMRMDHRQDKTAAEIVNFSTLEELSLILRDLGEEPRYSKLAKSIIASRPISTTTELARLIESVLGGRSGSTHSATRTFQALRMAVNDELGQLTRTLPMLPSILKPGGRLVVISFHSLEDRVVKNNFRESSYGYEAVYNKLTKKPILGATSDANNPRARSAKLRAVVKI